MKERIKEIQKQLAIASAALLKMDKTTGLEALATADTEAQEILTAIEGESAYYWFKTGVNTLSLDEYGTDWPEDEIREAFSQLNQPQEQEYDTNQDIDYEPENMKGETKRVKVKYVDSIEEQEKECEALRGELLNDLYDFAEKTTPKEPTLPGRLNKPTQSETLTQEAGEDFVIDLLEEQAQLLEKECNTFEGDEEIESGRRLAQVTSAIKRLKNQSPSDEEIERFLDMNYFSIEVDDKYQDVMLKSAVEEWLRTQNKG